MKRALLLVAICLAGLQACDNTGQEQLTPIETEILEIEGLIASQAETGFDEQELLSDIKAGTLTKTSYFHYKNGELVQSSYDNYIGSQWDAPYIFLDDGTCRHCCGFPDPINPYKYINYAWQYNQETKSIETRLYNFEDKFSAKVLYYNKESGKLILEGNFCDCIGVYGGGEPVADYSRMTFHIDLDPETREEYLNKYCNEYK